ncbi:hypothetical protein TNCV_5124321 [Trichonephila clavipes]|nr:hypothetical protein TNCV_5124321 [Trichonephila clavipes]
MDATDSKIQTNPAFGARNSQKRSTNRLGAVSTRWVGTRPTFFYLPFVTRPRIQCQGRGRFLDIWGGKGH